MEILEFNKSTKIVELKGERLDAKHLEWGTDNWSAGPRRGAGLRAFGQNEGSAVDEVWTMNLC